MRRQACTAEHARGVSDLQERESRPRNPILLAYVLSYLTLKKEKERGCEEQEAKESPISCEQEKKAGPFAQHSIPCTHCSPNAEKKIVDAAWEFVYATVGKGKRRKTKRQKQI